MMRALVVIVVAWFVLEPTRSNADWPIVPKVDRQPLQASMARLTEALDAAGEPLPDAIRGKLNKLRDSTNDVEITTDIQALLDPLCLAAIEINAESRVHVLPGPAQAQLMELGWTTFLIKVSNQAGVTARLRTSSPQSLPMVKRSSSASKPVLDISPAESERRWLDVALLSSPPLLPTLSGAPLEYRVIQLYSRDPGQREATISFDVGQGTQDLGFRNEIPVLFDCKASFDVPISVKDWDGKPTTCWLTIRDEQGRVYPNPSRRLAPDMFFHHQIYRADGESVKLPKGKFQITASRGPEYQINDFKVEIDGKGKPSHINIELKRWVHMAELGWISGDHHVHAAGCAHYENPTQGVTPEDMYRHVLGEDLNIGCVLSWGPCWYHQKQFFDGQTSSLSKGRYLMRYDVEVSGFPSSHAGHLCLLNLKEDDYPNTQSIEDWPSWTLPVLQWGKQQGGVVGYSHSGWGLQLPDYLPNGSRGLYPRSGSGGGGRDTVGRAADKLPDLAMPPFDGIGANEFIVAVTHDACDFISTVDTPAIWELNIWYHTLNCGYRTRISGETDFPCIYGERVGLGRVYVQLPKNAEYSFEDWAMGLKDGRSYVGDGLSHISEFTVNNLAMGHHNADGLVSQLDLPSKQSVTVKTRVSAMLPEVASESAKSIKARRLDEKPYWHLERARVGDTRTVPVELVVNGVAVATKDIVADGTFQDLKWEIALDKSSWVAVRILPSLHSNPIFVEIDDKPIRASLDSAKWCRQAVDQCWSKKRGQIRATETASAQAAYDSARDAYDAIIKELQ
ncbi:MAG: CehA/McbA family metallohydrolase [Pirellula sp.]